MKAKQINILDIPFTTLQQSDILELIKTILNQPAKQFFLATPNPEMLLLCQKNPKFKEILQQTDLNIPDGNGIIWANIFLNQTSNNKNKLVIFIKGFLSLITFPFHQKNDKKPFNRAIHGSDLMRSICHNEQLGKHKIFLLGNKQGLNENISTLTADTLRQTNQNINIVGNYDGNNLDKKNIERIKAAEPEILFIGFGAPQQEEWLAENLNKLPSVKLAIGVGGTFDFIAGIIPRAPLFMRKIGLEWLYRLYKQPKRIKRIINATIIFPFKIITERAKDHR